MVELLVVAVDGHTAVVGDGAWHRRYTGDDPRGGVVTQDGVGRLAALTATAQDVDLPVTHRHPTTLLHTHTHNSCLLV